MIAFAMTMALTIRKQPARAAPMGPMVEQGVEALPRGKFPWQARLADDNFARQMPLAHLVGLFCGGVLISPTYVLTAAHCLWYQNLMTGNVLDRRNRPMLVILGDHQRSVDEGSEQVIRVLRVIMHPGYTNPASGWYDQPDLALLELATPATLNDRVQPIAWLSPEEEAIHAQAGAVATMSGWGLFDDTQVTSDVLRESTLYVGSLSSTHFTCELKQSVMSGPGDSGGPFVVYVDGVPKLAGITSWALGFTRVAPQGAWLEHTIHHAPVLPQVYMPLMAR